LVESLQKLQEENEPTNPALWSRAVAAAKAKYDVYPSAYANAFASKWYKEKGGSWKTKKESISEDSPCWDGYKQVGMKMKNGKQVPNCVQEGSTFKITNTITKKEWAKTPKDYKSVIDGVHYVMKMTDKGTALVPVKIVEMTVTEANVGDFEIGDFVHFKSKNKTGMVMKISGNKVTINTLNGPFTGDIKDIQVLYQDGVEESHSGDPNDRYVVRPCKNPKEPWAVWEGEVRVKGFATKEEAQAFADAKNKEQFGEVTDSEEEDFHMKLDKLVHSTFGMSPDEEKNEATTSDVIKDLDKVKNDLLKKIEVLIAKKKKLYSDVDIESPMSDDEKKLDKEIADLFSKINQLVLQKRNLKKESVTEGNAFTGALFKARQEGLTEFEFNGKMYPVKKLDEESDEKEEKLEESKTNILKKIIKEEYHAIKSFMEQNGMEIGKVYSNPVAKSFIKEDEEEVVDEYDVENYEETVDFKEFLESYMKSERAELRELKFKSAGVKELLTTIFNNKNLLPKLGFKTFKEVLEFIKFGDQEEQAELETKLKKLGVQVPVFESNLKEMNLASAGVKEVLKQLYSDKKLVQYLGFKDFKGAVYFIKNGMWSDFEELRDDIAKYKKQLGEAEYQGRKVKLGKIMQGDVKKFKVYVKNDKGNVVKVNFGQGGDAKGGTMRIRKNNPEARASFRARHNCDSPGPRWKARYWSCKKW
jgi:virulence-associated protein VapD